MTGFFSSFEIADYSNVYRSNILPIDRSHMHGDLLIIDFESIFDRTNSQLKSIDENLIGNPVSSSMPKLLHWPNSKRMCIDLKNNITNHHARHNEHEKHRENVWKREIANILSNGGYLGFLLAYRLFVDTVSIYFVHTKRLSNDIKSTTIETIKNKSFRARILSRWSPNGHHLLFVNLLLFLFDSFVWETKKWNLYQIYLKIRVFFCPQECGSEYNLTREP